MWNPNQYEHYRDERSRPFFELVARVGAETPDRVIDLGCGPGPLTAALARRWPTAQVTGIDNDSDMLAAAAVHSGGRLRFEAADILTWRSSPPADVIVSNAALQWVPDHRGAVLARLVGSLAPGGWLAVQVPGNLHEPHHQAIASLAATEPWEGLLGDTWRRFDETGDPVDYADRLSELGCRVDTWETTYMHVLAGDDPVLEWVKGTALRPITTILQGRGDPGLVEQFCAELAPRLRSAFPARPYGTPFPFRRVFAVAQRMA